ncbi:MAG TPA: TerC family protein [Kofleriaceae bacterium]|nr:TerC family protein [Kofleriaceae bacterium]
MLDMLSSPEVWLAFATLTALEVVLGIDNLIFITILASRLPVEQRDKARKLGLAGAFVTRMGLLAGISWIVSLKEPLFAVRGTEFSGKALILLGGGLFLLYKATKEIHHKLETAGEDQTAARKTATFAGVVLQIVVIDMVFSLDSVITAVGMTDYIAVMVAANVVALIGMLLVGGRIGEFVERHPSVKMLALSFLLMIGLVLVGEGFGAHIPKGYIYGAMGFSVFVELLNIKTARKPKIVALNEPTDAPADAQS